MGYLPVQRVETAVEDLYATVQINSERAEELRALIVEILKAASTEARGETDRLEKRLHAIETRRRKVLDAYLAGAIEQDLLAEEQQRARRDTADTEQLLEAARVDLNKLEGKVLAAIALASSAEEVYWKSTPAMRRQYNQALFQKLYITEDGATRAALTEPFAALLQEDLLQHVHREVMRRKHDPAQRTRPSRNGHGAGQERTNPAAAYRPQGSISELMVPPAGFEPATHGLGNRRSIP